MLSAVVRQAVRIPSAAGMQEAMVLTTHKITLNTL